MKKEIRRKILTSILILLIGIITGYALMSIVYCFDFPENRYTETKQILAEEGYHPRELLRTGKSDYYQENYPDILDIGTDELIFEYSLRNTEENCFDRALVKRYGRYWHGYVVVLRPLMLVFDLAEVRLVNLGTQFLLFGVFVFLIYFETKKLRYLFLSFLAYFVLGPSSLACNMQYSSIYYVAIISGIVAIFAKKYINLNNRYIYLFLITGMVTSYIDFLTYPLLAWGIPATVVIALYEIRGKDNKQRYVFVDKIVQLILSAIAWIAGYIGMWAGKWLLGVIRADNDIWAQVKHETPLMIGSEVSNPLLRMQSFFKNWNHLTFKPFVVIFTIAFLLWAIAIIRKGVVKDYRIPAFVIMIFSAPVWYVVGYAHTWGHHIFTWRITLTTVIATLMIACLSTDYSGNKEAVLLKNRLFRTIGCLLCIVLGIVTYLVVPAEKQSNWNYDLAHEECIIPLGQENGYVMDFIPMYSHVCSVDPIITSQDYAGYIELVLLDGDRVIDTQKITFDGSEDSNIKMLPVDWHLKRGKRYQIAISTKNSKESAKIWITDDTSQYEFDGENAMGMRYTYYTHFVDKKAALFFVMSWTVAWMICGYLILFFRRSSRIKADK